MNTVSKERLEGISSNLALIRRSKVRVTELTGHSLVLS